MRTRIVRTIVLSLVWFTILFVSLFGSPSVLQAQSVPITVCGSINMNTTWNAGQVYYVTCDVTVPLGVTLTIQPGAIVKLTYDSSLVINGTLKATGTVQQPVTFTSFRDDSIGGDTNGDGASSGFAEDWGVIQFNAGSDDINSLIEHTIIRFGGNDGFSSDDLVLFAL